MRQFIHSFRNIRTRYVEIVISGGEVTPFADGSERTHVAQPVDFVLEPFEPGKAAPPTMHLTFEMMEDLLTQQWREGFRPEGWIETTPVVPTAEIERLAAENERLRNDLTRERVQHKMTGARLDKALELIGIEPGKRRIQVKRGGNDDGETEET